jgi:hypothetical protein
MASPWNLVPAIGFATVNARRKAGLDPSISSAKEFGKTFLKEAVIQNLWFDLAGPIAWAPMAFMGAQALGQVGYTMARQGESTLQSLYNTNFGGTFRDSQGSATMRERGMSVIANSRGNLASVLGREARLRSRSRFG